MGAALGRTPKQITCRPKMARKAFIRPTWSLVHPQNTRPRSVEDREHADQTRRSRGACARDCLGRGRRL